MTNQGTWINGQRVDPSVIAVRDRGFTLGDGVFETMRLHGRRVFRLEPHLARLERGLSALEIQPPIEWGAWISAAISEASGALGLAEARVRITISRGPGPAGVEPPRPATPTVVVDVGPLPDYGPALYGTGVTACFASGRKNERAMGAGIKAIGYTEGILAFLEARRDRKSTRLNSSH